MKEERISDVSFLAARTLRYNRFCFRVHLQSNEQIYRLDRYQKVFALTALNNVMVMTLPDFCSLCHVLFRYLTKDNLACDSYTPDS